MCRVALLTFFVLSTVVLGAVALIELDSPDPKLRVQIQSSGAEERVAAQGKMGDRDREVAAAPESARRMGGHRWANRSVAGGGVIVGGVVTAALAAVYCYIRVTRNMKDRVPN